MDLKRSTWIVGLYLWCLSVICTFIPGQIRRDRYYDYHSKHTNLCHFMRTILVWAPLVVVLNIAFYVLGFLSVIIIPLLWFPGLFFQFLLILGGVALSIVLIAVTVCGISKLKDVTYEFMRNKFLNNEDPTSVEVVWAYVKSFKNSICPFIDIGE